MSSQENVENPSENWEPKMGKKGDSDIDLDYSSDEVDSDVRAALQSSKKSSADLTSILSNLQVAISSSERSISISRELSIRAEEEEAESRRARSQIIRTHKLKLQNEKQLKEMEVHQERLRFIGLKAISADPPGLRLLKNGGSFRNFNAGSLSLEADFGYPKRLNEEGCLDGDPLEFLLRLSPETHSHLIKSNVDFKAICNYITYYLSVCVDQSIYDCYKKALFDLFNTYGYQWQLELSDILEIFLNLGVNESVIKIEEKLQEMNAIKLRLEAVQKDLRENGQEIQFPVLIPEFKSWNPIEQKDEITENSDCLARFLEFVTDLYCTHPGRVKLVYETSREDRTRMMIFFYFIGLISTDVGLIRNAALNSKISLMFHTIIDHLDRGQWSGKKNANTTRGPILEYMYDSALIDITEMYFEIGSHIPPECKTWSKESLPEVLDIIDHHHNYLHRLSLFPASLRGNELRKRSASLILYSVVAGPTNVELQPSFGSMELLAFVCKFSKELSNLLKEGKEEYYIFLTVVKLFDIIIGNEIALTFNNAQNKRNVGNVLNIVKEYEKNIVNNFEDENPTILKNVINNIVTKWDIYGTNSEHICRAVSNASSVGSQ